jgi:putative ABC transport system substrate-binding protein
MRRRDLLAAIAGAAIASPLSADAQQRGRTYRVGILAAGPPIAPDNPLWAAFDRAMRKLGYAEQRNLHYERRFAQGKLETLPALASDLVAADVDVVVVFGPAIRAAKAAISKTPVVMVAGSSDPVGEGLVASLARPGGNVTGLTYAVSSERVAKQLELLKEADRRISRVAILWDLDDELFRRAWAPALEQAASRLGLHVHGPVQVRHGEGFEPAFARISRDGIDAVLIATGGIAFANRAQIGRLAAQYRLPTMAAFRDFPRAGGLMSYGPVFTDIYRRAAILVDRILKGGDPAEMPVEQPTIFEFVINLEAAKAIGIEIPSALLARADEVIE